MPCASSFSHPVNTHAIHGVHVRERERDCLQLQPSMCKPGCRAPRVREIIDNPRTNCEQKDRSLWAADSRDNCVGGDWRYREIVTRDREQAACATRRSKRRLSKVPAYGFTSLPPEMVARFACCFWRSPCWTQQWRGWTQLCGNNCLPRHNRRTCGALTEGTAASLAASLSGYMCVPNCQS